MLQMQNPINAPQGTFKATKDPIFPYLPRFSTPWRMHSGAAARTLFSEKDTFTTL